MENNLYDHYNEIPDFDEYEDRNRRGQRTPREPRDWRGNVVKVIVSICLMLFTIYALIIGLELLAKSVKGSSYKDLDLAQELHEIEREDKKTEPDGNPDDHRPGWNDVRRSQRGSRLDEVSQYETVTKSPQLRALDSRGILWEIYMM